MTQDSEERDCVTRMGKETWKGHSDSEPSPLERKLAET